MCDTELFKYIGSQEFLTHKFGVNGSKVNHPFTCNPKSSLSRDGGLKLFLESTEFGEISIQFEVSNPNQILIYFLWLEDYKITLDDSERHGFFGSDHVLINVGQGNVKKWEEYFQSEEISDLTQKYWEFVICTETVSPKNLLM